MKTIEERATKYANETIGERDFLSNETMKFWDEAFNSYVEIATEQKKIYIDKACAWIMDELRNPKADTFQEFVDYFRKAMEE